MGFLSDLFDISPSKGRTESAPAAPTPQQQTLQRQAIQVGDQQLGNLGQTTDLFERLMSGLTRNLDQGQRTDTALFGRPPGGRNDFIANQKRELEQFKRSLSPGPRVDRRLRQLR